MRAGAPIITNNELLSANQETCAAAPLPPVVVAPFIPSLSDDAELVRDLPPYPLHHTTSRTPDAGPSAALCVDTFHSLGTSPEVRDNNGA